jgi:hypothetical protein
MRNNTKSDPGEMWVDDVEWMKLAGGTVSALINTIMNLRVSQSAGNTFIIWPSVGC